MIRSATANLSRFAAEVMPQATTMPTIPVAAASSIGPASPTIETLTPTDEATAAGIVRHAFECQQAVYPVGGGTGLNFGLPQTRPGVALSLGALNRVLDHPADDLTVTAEAGITLAELNRHLTAKQQWLPIDAAEPEKATLGGIIATNACGPRRHGYGTIGDYLLGFRAIDGRGELYRGGGKVVKNAAGYNLPRLMVGALGRLGVITEAAFMVRPLPACAAMAICDISSLQQIEILLAGLGASRAMPTIVELLVGPARANCPLPAMRTSASARLAVGFEGSSVEVQAMLGTLCDDWKLAGINDVTTIAGAGVASIANWLAASPAVLQINVLPGRMVGLVEQFAKLFPAHPLQAHAASGVIRVYPRIDGSAGDADEFVTIVTGTLRPLAIAAGGHLTLLATPEGVELTADDIWGPPRNGEALMRAIRQSFDPAGILNPGRF